VTCNLAPSSCPPPHHLLQQSHDFSIALDGTMSPGDIKKRHSKELSDELLEEHRPAPPSPNGPLRSTYFLSLQFRAEADATTSQRLDWRSPLGLAFNQGHFRRNPISEGARREETPDDGRYIGYRPNDRQAGRAEAMPAASQSYACWTSECNALTAASRLSTGTNRLTECGDNTYLSGTIP
jgi:hypothetical protein